MIKKLLIIIFTVLVMTAIISAAEVSTNSSNVTKVTNVKNETASSQPIYVGRFGIGYNGGLNFRFWPSASLGYEIPLSGSYTSGTSATTWNILSGVNFLLPLKNIFGISTYFEPGIILGSSYSANNVVNGTVSETVNCSFIAGITVGLEAEIFLNRIYYKLPANMSLGSKIALNSKTTVNESWDNTYYSDGTSTRSNYQRSNSYNLSMANSGSTLTAFTIRYYF